MSELREVESVRRTLGVVRGDEPGPTLICVGGLHGNEPAGVQALLRVLPALGGRATELRGELVALAGNRAALAARRRFVDRDLNRAWTPERVRRLLVVEDAEWKAEDREQVELLREIDEAVARARGPVYALDLHTTSAPGGVFSAFPDSLPQRDFARHFPVPMIFGLQEQVDGTLLSLLSDRGLIAVTVESGRHEEPEAVDRSEAAVWIGIVAAGLLPEPAVPEAAAGRTLLRSSSAQLPAALEMRYRHPVARGDDFEMAPGLRNFQTVERGQVIARDRRGDLRVGEDSRLLMPLYQEQGEDGYFLVREFRPLAATLAGAAPCPRRPDRGLAPRPVGRPGRAGPGRRGS